MFWQNKHGGASGLETPAKRKLLIVAESNLRRALMEQFCLTPGLVAMEAETARAALQMVETAAPDVMLLSSDLSDPDAPELLRQIRAAGRRAPAILLARGESQPAGFDAVVALPLRFAQLLAVMKRLCARSAGAQETSLTEKESAILARLARADGEVVAREALLRDVFGYSPGVATHTLETHIHRLRRKLERAPRAARVLETAPGGYRLAETRAVPRQQSARN
ncbi:MAG TPA: response regulator transcription factor [Methylocystis sp.]|nr:response regulator transcription factor [Methylocystis sp.]